MYKINLAANGPPLVEERVQRKGLGLADNLKGLFTTWVLLMYWTVLSLHCFCAGFLELWRAATTLRLVCILNALYMHNVGFPWESSG